MGEMFNATGWTALLAGLFTISAAVGALRKPGIWQKLVQEVEESPALQMVSGLLELFAGATIYLLNAWAPADIPACLMKTMGGLMMLEALAVVGFSDIYFHFWLKNLAHMHKGWASVTLVIGVALTVLGMVRLA